MENKEIEKNELKIGDKAPDFSFVDSKNMETKLSSYRGRNVVVYFYPKDFTPGCTIEAEEFSKDYEKFREKNITVIGISPDDDKSHEKFKIKMNIPYELASDRGNEISKRYGVYGMKTFMGKKYMGINRTTFLIDEKGFIKKIFNKVKPKGHSQDVLTEFA